MNFRDLHYITEVARHLHFGKAAEACHVSQPALSMQVQKLEDELGVQIFERSQRRVMITQVGEEIVERARRLLEGEQAMKEIARAHRDPLAGTVALGVFPTLAPYLLPQLMPPLSSALPRVEWQLVEEKTPILVERLEAGELDAALLAMPVEGDGLSHVHLFNEPFLLAVSKHHPLAVRKEVRLSELANETMLLLEDGHCLREQALSVCHSMGVGEAKNFRATSLETLRHMVAASDKVTLIPKLACTPDDASMRYIPFAPPAPSRSIALYFRRTSGRVKLFEAMAEVIRRGGDKK